MPVRLAAAWDDYYFACSSHGHVKSGASRYCVHGIVGVVVRGRRGCDVPLIGRAEGEKKRILRQRLRRYERELGWFAPLL